MYKQCSVVLYKLAHLGTKTHTHTLSVPFSLKGLYVMRAQMTWKERVHQCFSLFFFFFIPPLSFHSYWSLKNRRGTGNTNNVLVTNYRLTDIYLCLGLGHRWTPAAWLLDGPFLTSGTYRHGNCPTHIRIYTLEPAEWSLESSDLSPLCPLLPPSPFLWDPSKLHPSLYHALPLCLPLHLLSPFISHPVCL